MRLKNQIPCVISQTRTVIYTSIPLSRTELAGRDVPSLLRSQLVAWSVLSSATRVPSVVALRHQPLQC